MTQEQMQYLAVEEISVLPQIRDEWDEASVRGLAMTMREHGQLQPIRVRSDGERMVVVDGHRRLAAAKLAGLELIAAIVEGRPLGEAEVVERQLVSGVHQQPLQPLERARAIERLQQATGWTNGDVARRLGMSNATVSRLLALLELPEEIREQVAAGRMPYSTAVQLLQVRDEQQQAELAQQVSHESLSREAVASAVKAKPSRKRAAKSPRPSSETALLREVLAVPLRGSELTLASFVTWLDDLLGKARSSLAEKQDLSTFVASLRRQSAA